MQRKTNTILVGLGLIVACILVSGFVGTESVSAYTASITTNNSISFDISPSGDGTSIHSESINVQSDCRAGYNLTIATPEGSSLYKYSNNTQADTASFTAVDGASALSSSNNTNKWGYTLTSNPTSSTVFSPLSSTASILKTSSQTASPSADINDTFNINYGAKVDSTITPGTYQMANSGAIVYYLTMDTTCTQYTVAFNPNGGTGTMDNQGIEAGEPTNLSANTFTAPAFGSSYEDANGDTIAGTANTYWRFNGWNTAIDGTGISYDNEEEVEDLAGIGSTITLYAQWEALSAMVVNFNTNGMEFEDGTTSNTLGYYHDSVNRYVSYPSYSHTANINDDGTQISSTKYANNLATKDVVTIPNADSLHVTIKYGTEDNWDMLYVFQGTYTGSVTRNMNAGQLAKYMGGNNTTTTVEIDIPGDTATFAFYSDSSGQYWGYHATIVGYYDEEPASYESTIPVYRRALVYGEYQEPAPDDDHLFLGWSESSTATTPDYTSATDILDNLQGDNGDTKTLYAIWNPRYHITYTNNCQTYISGNEACTADVSNSTGSEIVNLNSSGDGSTTLPSYNYNSWAITGWKIKGWSTVADNSSNANTEYLINGTYSVTGQSAGDGIVLYAHWVPLYTIQYDGNGADNANSGMGSLDTSTGLKSVKQINIGEGDAVTLLPSNFKRTGYGFAGWSTDPDAWAHFTDNDGTNDPIIYGSIETIKASPYPVSGIMTYYATWIPAATSGNSPVYLQDFNMTDCGNLTQTIFDSTTGTITVNKNSMVALTDKRDNQVYAIARLADGNCWMVENLRLVHGGTVGNNINDNSVTNQSLSQGYGGTPGLYGSFVGLANSESFNASTASSNSIYKSSSNPPVDTYNPSNNTLEDIGTTNSPLYRFPRYSSVNTTNYVSNTTYTQDYINASNPSNSGTNYRTSSNIYSYGNYYTWAAAIANTNYYTDSSSESAGTSICPSNWHLPSNSGADKEFGTLFKSYGGTGSSQTENSGGDVMSSRFRTFPNNFIYSGTNSGYRGQDGRYWGRSAYNSGFAYHTSIEDARVLPAFQSGTTSVGDSVRCLINPTTIEIVLNSNDGTDTLYKLYGVPEDTVNLPTVNSLHRVGYKLTNWNTMPDGSGANYTTSYAIPAGSTGTILYAQWSPTYSVQYNGNGADNPNGMGTTDANGIKSVKQINVVENDPLTLLASNFKRAGYGFAGWSTDPDAWTHFTDNDNTNDPIIYGPMETISAPAYPTNGTSIVTMYAVWVPAEKDGNNNPVYLQDFDITECDNLTSTTFNSTTGTITPGGVIALTDKRDNQVYTIAKLADGNCWMTENLRLEVAGTVGNNINDNTVTNESLSERYGKYSGSGTNYGNFTGLADAETSNFYNSTTANSLYSTTTSGAKIVIGSSDYAAYRFPRYNHNNTYSLVDSTTYTQDYAIANSPTDSGTNYRTNSNVYSYGNYYTWAAAMANTNHYSQASYSEDAETSICPAGWRLPTSGGETVKEYSVLSKSYGGTGGSQGEAASGSIMSNRFRSFPNNYLLSGYYSSSSHSDRGVRGYYWSRSAEQFDSRSYRLYFQTTSIAPSSVVEKYYGQSVRCLISGIYTIQYDGNGADNPNGMGYLDVSTGRKSIRQINITEGDRVRLFPSNFKRSGYSFIGWSTNPNATLTSGDKIYGPIETIEAPAHPHNRTNTLTMYAVWVEAEKDNNDNPIYLQDFDALECSNLSKATYDPDTEEITPGDVIALTDKRDNETYAVAKLADGNCWMIENLRLNNQYTMGQNQNDSSVTNQSLAQGYASNPGQYGSFVGLANPEFSDFSSSTTANSVYKSSANPPVDTYDPLNSVLEDISTSNYPNYRMPRYNNINTNTIADSTVSVFDNTSSWIAYSGTRYTADNIYSYGNYYNWSAAMATTKYYASQSSSQTEVAGTSLCPKNWSLPTSNSAKEGYCTLSKEYGGINGCNGETNTDGTFNQMRSFPNNFLLAGYYSSSTVSNRGGYGFYWTRSKKSYSVNSANALRIMNDAVNPSFGQSVTTGASVRCLIVPQTP